MAKDTSNSQKNKEQIQTIQATDAQLTTRAYLSLFGMSRWRSSLCRSMPIPSAVSSSKRQERWFGMREN